jgi:hypothetical protein
MTTEEMMKFKKNYLDRLSKNSKKIILVPPESRRRDAWSQNVFGSSEYTFMFDVLIPNEEHAKEYGYDIAF